MKRVILIIVTMLVFFSVSFILAEKQGWMDSEFIRTHMEELRESTGGRTAVLIGIVLILSIDLILPVPSSIVMVMSGVMLGTWLGTAASFVGAMLAALVGYYGCRVGGQRVFTRFVGDADQNKVKEWFEDYGVAAIIISRPVPMLTEILSCMAGLSRVKPASFITATIVGTLPICLIYAYVGQLYGLNSLESNAGIATMVWITVAIPACGWLFTHWVKRARSRNNAKGEMRD
jgi:uncharacterized membrane protein YdjX (TVP38/TMEM64 family)